MAKKTHGHAPRVRQRQNSNEQRETYIQVNTDKLMNTVVSSAIGAAVGTAITRSINGD